MNLLELIQFAIEYTETRDARYVEAYNEMDLNCKKFIRAVLRFMTLEVMHEFNQAMNALADIKSTVFEKLNAIEVIKNQMKNEGFSGDFARVGGVGVIAAYLNHGSTILKYVVLKCAIEMLNDDDCKHCFIESSILPLIVSNFPHVQFEVGKTAMRATSLLATHNDLFVNKFIAAGGTIAVASIFNNGDKSLLQETCSLIIKLSEQSNLLQDQILIHLHPNRIVYRLNESRNSYLGEMLSLIGQLAKSHLWTANYPAHESIVVLFQEILGDLSQIGQANN